MDSTLRPAAIAALRRPLLLALLASPVAAQPAPWPAGPATEIGHEGQPGGLPAGFEASGVAWHPGRGSVVVVSDSGLVAELSPEGGVLAAWPLAGDLEALALVDPASSRIYVGVEHPDSVVEFDLATGQATGASWNLTPWMTGPANEGLEALACVEGVVHAGLQLDGRIFRFVLQPGGVVQFLGSFPSHKGRADLAGLEFDACTGVLLALHDTADVVVEYDAAGTFLREYAAAGSDQEGLALRGGAPGAVTRLFLAQDTGEVLRFEDWPVAPCAPGTWADLGGGTSGSAGAVALVGSGPLQAGWPVSLQVAGAPAGAPLLLLLAVASQPQAAWGGTLHALPAAAQIVLQVDGGGGLLLTADWPAGLAPGLDLWFQALAPDAGVPGGIVLSNALRATTP